MSSVERAFTLSFVKAGSLENLLFGFVSVSAPPSALVENGEKQHGNDRFNPHSNGRGVYVIAFTPVSDAPRQRTTLFIRSMQKPVKVQVCFGFKIMLFEV